jgi:hypothetical protein
MLAEQLTAMAAVLGLMAVIGSMMTSSGGEGGAATSSASSWDSSR